MFGKVVLLIKRMRWKALFFQNETKSTFNYGFETCKCPLQHKDLMEFEDDLQKKISNVQFRRVNNDFQNRLKNDIRSIQSSKKVLVLWIKQETFMKWKNDNMKNFCQITLQKHINNLTTTFVTVSIWKQHISLRNLK